MINLKPKRTNTFDRYNLAPVLLRLMLEHGKDSTWADITKMLEEHVLEKYAVEIKLFAPNVQQYYASLKTDVNSPLKEIADERQSMAEKWLRSLDAIYDQVADSKVLLQANFKNRNSRDYVLVSKNLQDIMRLLAEIHQSANFNAILRESMQNLVYSIIRFIKEYDFPELKGASNLSMVKVKGGSGYPRKELSARAVARAKKGLLQHIISRLPEASDVFVDQESEMQAQEVRDQYTPAITQ